MDFDVAVSLRLERYVRRTFAEEAVDEVMLQLLALESEPGVPAPERIMAAVVLEARGDFGRFIEMLDLARTDWRDALVVADLAHENWREELNRRLGKNS